ncbi:T9SS type A sorting domain-containing protein [Marinilongibacter aquaticus]|uniref:T9SS type A sorting domain-containing protein n=1 Tax=Marinilongibacter aquaticus TaxID=2975157 RepID=UPI0021BD8B6E|nr:T9SS type A sorting domain-containing protein [Marinilongibacter aquaticus]UBM58469.1 T9SS type A sorting domain-containing protein [Marinilongibacter aquaticus]
MNKDEMVIYLNEEDAKVYVKVPSGKKTHFQLQDLPGKVLQEAVHDKGIHDFDLAGLADGNYFVIVNQNDYIRSKKIVLGYQP